MSAATIAMRTRALHGAIVAAAFVVAAGLADRARMRALDARAAWPAEADALYLPPADFLRRASLGHHELAADLVAARTFVYFGTQLLSKGQQRWLTRYLDTVADLDPYHQSMYDRGGPMLLYGGKAITVESVEAADAYLRRGLRVFPNDWRLWYQLAVNELYELPRLVSADDPRRARWLADGTEALRQATLDPAAPAWLATLAARRMTDSGNRELAIEHLKRVYAMTSDENAREQLRYKLIQLIGEQREGELEREREQLRELHDRYPYAPEAFSIIMGPPPAPAVDTASLAAP